MAYVADMPAGAATAAGVAHFKTTYELTASVAKLLPSFKPDQLATVVQALGSAGVNDLDLYKVIASSVPCGLINMLVCAAAAAANTAAAVDSIMSYPGIKQGW